MTDGTPDGVMLYISALEKMLPHSSKPNKGTTSVTIPVKQGNGEIHNFTFPNKPLVDPTQTEESDVVWVDHSDNPPALVVALEDDEQKMQTDALNLLAKIICAIKDDPYGFVHLDKRYRQFTIDGTYFLSQEEFVLLEKFFEKHEKEVKNEQ